MSYPVEAAVEKTEEPRQQFLSKIWDRDNTNLLILFGITFVSVYYLPAGLTKLIFLVFLYRAYKTKNDYFWLAWLFIMVDAPGRLFSASGLHDLRIPIYTFLPGMSIEFEELLLFMYIAKHYFLKEKAKFVFQKSFSYFIMVSAFVFLVSIVEGIDQDNILETLRNLIPWAWVLVAPSFLSTPEKVLKFSKLLFPFVFLALALQVHSFMQGQYLDDIIRGVQGEFNLAVEGEEEASRSYSSVCLLLYSLIQALFYLFTKQKSFRSVNYLGGVVFCAFTSIFLSATRGYILGFGLLIFLTFFQMMKGQNMRRLINFGFAALVLVLILQWSFPLIDRQVKATFERLSTLKKLAAGDVTAGGTLMRIDVRGKRVLNEFYKSPIIGWGFSNTYFRYADGHVGFQTVLLNGGIIGAFYLNLFFFLLVLRTWKFSLRNDMMETWGGGLKVYAFALISIYLIHGSSTMFWGFIMHFEQTEKILTFAFLFASFNAMVISVLPEDKPKPVWTGIGQNTLQY